MKIKKGDLVQVISGRYKGQKCKVSSTIKNKNQVVLEQTNLKTKHVKPRQTDEKGYIKQIAYPIHYSNIKLIQDKD